MTSWGILIFVGSIALGLKRPASARHTYAAGFILVLVAVLYAGLHQHTL